jgi:hypothetical protein
MQVLLGYSVWRLRFINFVLCQRLYCGLLLAPSGSFWIPKFGYTILNFSCLGKKIPNIIGLGLSFSLGFKQTLIDSQYVCGCEKGFGDGEEMQAYACDGSKLEDKPVNFTTTLHYLQTPQDLLQMQRTSSWLQVSKPRKMVRLTAALISALNDGSDLATIETLSVPNRNFDQVLLIPILHCAFWKWG